MKINLNFIIFFLFFDVGCQTLLQGICLGINYKTERALILNMEDKILWRKMYTSWHENCNILKGSDEEKKS